MKPDYRVMFVPHGVEVQHRDMVRGLAPQPPDAVQRLRGPLPKLYALLIASVLAVLFVAQTAYAHKANFLPVGWSGPWYDGSTSSGHPERLCGQSYPAYACLVASASYLGVGLQRWPIRVTNNQGLDVRYCTNDTSTPGWIVVIGVTGLSWSFTPTFEYSQCNTPSRCNMLTPGTATGIASLPWNSSAGTYYQSTHHGSYCW